MLSKNTIKFIFGFIIVLFLFMPSTAYAQCETKGVECFPVPGRRIYQREYIPTHDIFLEAGRVVARSESLENAGAIIEMPQPPVCPKDTSLFDHVDWNEIIELANKIMSIALGPFSIITDNIGETVGIDPTEGLRNYIEATMKSEGHNMDSLQSKEKAEEIFINTLNEIKKSCEEK